MIPHPKSDEGVPSDEFPPFVIRAGSVVVGVGVGGTVVVVGEAVSLFDAVSDSS